MKQIKYFLILLAVIIVAIIAINYINSKPNKVKNNPYEYNVDEYKKVDPELISHKEIRQIKVSLDEQAGLTTFNGRIFLASDNEVKILSTQGNVESRIPIQPDARAVAANNQFIAVAYKNFIEAYTYTGESIYKTEVFSDSSVFTSLVIWNENVVVADAGKRRLFGFKDDKINFEIEGISGAKNLHGFIVPSPYFEVALNAENELWCTNPGMHALQQYEQSGELTTAWDKASMDIDGFTGCCNPAQFATLPDGRFVTSEKGMPRIKIYSKTGELQSVVAAPSKFDGNQHAAEVAAIGDTIIALDFDREMLRIFEPI